MEEQSNQTTPTEKFHTQHHGAHSGSHAGISDYNDGEKLSHYGGNDDTYQISGDEKEDEEFDGSVANENESDNENEQEEDYGKSHSGL